MFYLNIIKLEIKMIFILSVLSVNFFNQKFLEINDGDLLNLF